MNHCEHDSDYAAFFHSKKADETKADKDAQCKYGLRDAKFGTSPARYAAAVAEETVEVAIASSKVAAAPMSPRVLPENWRR
jgi:hypothetical protein